MQFGKFHGIVLLGFGFFLLALQAWLVLENTTPPVENPGNRPEATSRIGEERVRTNSITYLPAVIGGIAVTLGGTLLLVHHEKKIEAQMRREDASSHGHA